MKNKYLFLFVFLTYFMVGCSTEVIEYYDPKDESEIIEQPKPKPIPIDYLKFNITGPVTDLLVEEAEGVYSFETTGGDPNIRLEALTKPNDEDSVVLTFDYIAPTGVSELEVFYSMLLPTGNFDVVGGREEVVGDMPATDSWKTISFNLHNSIKNYGWGQAGDFLRLDFGRESGVSFKIKNLYLRSMNDAEKDEVNKGPASVIDFTIDIERSKVNGVDLSQEGDVYNILTTSGDPYIYSDALTEERSSEAVVLSFDYIAPQGVTTGLQLLLSPEAGDRFIDLPEMEPTTEWKSYSVNLKDTFADPKYSEWGKVGDFLRIDFGGLPDIEIKMRNIRLSTPD